MNNPTWNALAREAAIAAEHFGAGATIVGKANYAHHAHYGQAFFSLSTGIERGAKLALAVNHALNNEGSFPDAKVLRSFGHKLSDLLAAVNSLGKNMGLPSSELMPNSIIHVGIVSVLTEFADNVTRYYNLDFVMGSVHKNAQGDPIASWYELVTLPILEKHLTARSKEKIERNARQISALMEPITLVSHTSETGEHLSSVYDSSVRTGLTEFVNPLVRMYVLQIARFYSHVMSALTYDAYKNRMDFIPHLSEFFAIYNNEDSYLKSRKIWSIY